MKYYVTIISLLICCLPVRGVYAQSEDEKLNLPGDNLNLYAALKVFQESATLEGFEKTLNADSSKINNLDLNGDNKIDYIRVADNLQGDVHNITLKVAVSKDQDQNVAVFVVKKDKDGRSLIQVIGDEDLYGKDYIIEPDNETSGSTPNPGYQGNANAAANNNPVAQNHAYRGASTWPVIDYIYEPAYVSWQSPWYWGNYPSYWHPWTPYYWHYYYGYNYYWHYYFNSHYRRAHSYRFEGWQEHYYQSGARSRSAMVQAGVSQHAYQRTYSRPALAKQGSAVFITEHPKAASGNEPLPSFDETGRPVINRPPVTNAVSGSAIAKPAISEPVKKPVTESPAGAVIQPVLSEPGTLPLSKPVVTAPGTKPLLKPIVTDPAKPAAQPVLTQPGAGFVTKPAVTKPISNPAATDPARPLTTPNEHIVNPVIKAPVTEPRVRPVIIKPRSSPPINRPVDKKPASIRPVNASPAVKPAFTRPAPAKPPRVNR